MSKLGLRYPPANTVDREAHAARVALLAEDCADLPEEWLDIASREWAKQEPFFPRACELRALAERIGRELNPPPPEPEIKYIAPPEKPLPPPLSVDEIRRLPPWLVRMGIRVGAIGKEEFDAVMGERNGG